MSRNSTPRVVPMIAYEDAAAAAAEVAPEEWGAVEA
jgi:hypothetical protein